MSSIDQLKQTLNNLKNSRSDIEDRIEELRKYKKNIQGQKNIFRLQIQSDLKTINYFESSFWKGKRATKFKEKLDTLYKQYEKRDYIKDAYNDPIDKVEQAIDDLKKELRKINGNISSVSRQINRGE